MIGENHSAAGGFRLMRFSDFPTPAAKFNHLHRWGPWLLDTERLVLCLCRDHDDPLSARYEVDIERIETAESLLFWISHIAAKNWGDAQTVGHLALALDDLFCPRHRLFGGQQRPAPELLKLSIERDWA
ncbi:hypothetical protein HHL26_06610 [Sphingobium sp. TB-6]|uniref:hypothetical protein n=1 Tax=Sphingobium sp. TB-6 TaxID=2728850 RepID=UPI00146CA650|nr:hypothetical protein [Sphingobium sp. TB-6]NML88738.1 hypothetical protein [Sphingobium sp. TB-6]